MSSSTRWYKERKKEGYYRMAKKEGYRARSAYKLQQINEKYRILGEGDAVADLGCAPGGWSQVLVEVVGQEGLVVGVDLQRTKPIPGAHFIQGDFMKRDTHARLGELLSSKGRAGLDAVVSDMAPDMSGNYELDQVRSVQLAEMALDFAQKRLREGGHFACKVFEGSDFPQFRAMVRESFRSVYQYHPPASRKSSSELYLVAKRFKGRPEEPAEPREPMSEPETPASGEPTSTHPRDDRAGTLDVTKPRST
jgi:23S rRNA (uridine2552-2'-O)-methyltransferase